MASAPNTPSRPWGRYVAAAVAAALGLALIVLLVLFRWNWLRGPLADAISARTHRPVTISGNLEVHPWSWAPTATVNGLVIGNTPWGGSGPLASLPRLTVQVKILPLLRGKVILPLVEVDQPAVNLMRDAKGRANWVFNDPPRPIKLPAINHLIIHDGAIGYVDVGRRATFAGTISSNEQATGADRGSFRLEGKGALKGAHFAARVSGGPLVNIDPSRAYPFDARIEAGATRIRLEGRIDHPFNFAALSGKLSVSGADLKDLYDLTGLALPNSPPYALAAGFSRRGAVVALSGLRGRMGESDLEGDVSIDNSSGRPFVKADLASRRLRLSDAMAIVGGVPKRNARALLSPDQKLMAARLTAEHRMLPDSHLDVTRVRAMDARVSYRADRVEAGKTPLRGLSLKVSLDHGVIDVDPLDLSLPQGRLAGSVRIDARRDTPAEAIDLRLSNGRLESLMAAGPHPAIEGGLYARAKLSGVGDSVRAMAGSANGALTLVIPGGEIRQALAELLGIDATKGLFLLIAKDQGETPIRCAVADFRATNGVLTARRIVLDTGVVLVNGTGDLNLRDETVNLDLRGKPKKFRLVRIKAPITVRGRLASPRIGVDIVKAAPQALISAAVGVLAAPLAAILPFVSPGLAKDADCAALVAEAHDKGAPATRRR